MTTTPTAAKIHRFFVRFMNAFQAARFGTRRSLLWGHPFIRSSLLGVTTQYAAPEGMFVGFAPGGTCITDSEAVIGIPVAPATWRR